MKKTNNGIILFGDSVFLGIGASRNIYGCGMILKSMLTTPALIKAEGRNTTRDALNRIEKDVLSEENYNYVFILFGNNDCRLIDINTPKIILEEYKENLKKMLQLLLAIKKTPIILNLQPLNNERAYNSLLSIRKYAKGIQPYDWQKQYSDTCKEVAFSCGINFIDIRTDLEKEGNTVIANDGLHPNDKGHRLIATVMEKEIRNIFLETVTARNEG